MNVIPLKDDSSTLSDFQTDGSELGLSSPITVTKPWGTETWWKCNGKFRWKTLTIKFGHRFSLQYHPQQIKVLRVISGRMEVTYGEDRDRMKTEEFGPVTVFNVPQGLIHRVKAVGSSDLVLDAVSTPEHDTRRLEDDYGRE